MNRQQHGKFACPVSIACSNTVCIFIPLPSFQMILQYAFQSLDLALLLFDDFDQGANRDDESAEGFARVKERVVGDVGAFNPLVDGFDSVLDSGRHWFASSSVVSDGGRGCVRPSPAVFAPDSPLARRKLATCRTDKAPARIYWP